MPTKKWEQRLRVAGFCNLVELWRGEGGGGGCDKEKGGLEND